VRLDPADSAGGVGIYPAVGGDGAGPLLLFARGAGGWTLQVRREATVHAVPLPADFDAAEFQHLRVCVGDGRAVLRWGAEPLIETEVPEGAGRVGLYVRHGCASFDLVRATATGGAAACGLPALLIPGNA
jgi:hypothetical protein